MTRQNPLGSQGREDGSNPDAASPSSEKPRNSSGSASVAASVLDLRQHVNAIEEVLDRLARMGIVTDEDIMPIRRLRSRGFRTSRGV